ncbi:thioredoxin family protein [Pseudomonas fragariae (ex Marin et al. 2024)]|uniref:thioredoxin family protein n=1 Tax=Pseudomonas TaxID=286 RepID=UPI0023F80E76|nr:thioredoxin domain-containing protein [Pseudomonas syringae]MDF5776333.1 thioredoxin domain-containing protein [Pseudomonas syringae pv. syringae]
MSVMTVTDSTFQKDVIEASNQKLVVVEFSTKVKVNKRGEDNASARMDTIFNALEEKYAGKVSLVRVEIELDSHLNPVTSTQYQINHGPTMVFFKAGARAREDLVGQQTKERMTQILDELLSAS